ncbi:MAG TPA: tRNA (adenosine(37)-N6)-threonylcarbamoyltransferase complex dimerization subunit type 1 TsaB [Methylomirabilota bacterium]|nr:tRNA (adenosine(37)-N6)-threonylcarbamoyltransferase complex dimerization subunit type 1 TsaB [Methylomirabilota bacterium]
MIIALDGASTDLSLALADPDGTLIAEDAWSSAQRQSAELLPRLLALLEREERRWGATTALGVGTGPGSFTGLRVAMALAKGLAFALGRPLVGIGSLAAWLHAEPEAHAAVARAGAREAYLLFRGAEEPRIVEREELASLAGRVLVAPAELAAAFELEGTRSPRGAGAIAALVAARLVERPSGDDVSILEPAYLRLPRGLRAQSGEQVRWL